MKKILFIVSVLMMLVLPSWAQEAPAVEHNLTADCITDYDPTIDYFPDKVEVNYASGLEIEYFNNYKVVRATKPFPNATEADVFEYVLVQCGTPAPDGYNNAQMIEVPTGKLIAMSTTQLPHLSELGLLEYLIGLDSFLYVNTPAVRALIASDNLIEIGSGSALNLELVLEAEPDMVMTYSSGFHEYDSHPILLDAGIFVAMNNEWMENTPLGRAEWLKFTALFYNQEAAANALFDKKVADYEDLVALTANLAVEDKPTVLPNTFSSYSEAWDIPGADSYIAQLLRDAGATIILGDAPEAQGQVGSVPFDFETVYEAGLEADFWIISSFGVDDLDTLLAEDERYADFTAANNGNLWNNNGRVNENGGNDYWETGFSDPALILADLIAIFHPDLLPNHEIIFHRRLE